MTEHDKNVLSNRFELREKPVITYDQGRSSLMTPDCHKLTPFRPLTREAMNSISRKIKENGLEIESLRQNIEEYVYSEETPQYDPVAEFLNNLPQWDGRNHIGKQGCGKSTWCARLLPEKGGG